MPNVFVVQTHAQRDFKEAETYGDLLFMARHHLNGPEADIVAAWETTIDEALDKFNPGEDYILVTGDPVVIALAGARIALAVAEGTIVSFLKWDRMRQSYYAIEVTL